MNKRNLKFILLFSASLIGFFFFQNELQKKDTALQQKEEEIGQLWDDKLAMYQYTNNDLFRLNKIPENNYFDSLDLCYNILRRSINKSSFKNEDKAYLMDFMFNRTPFRIEKDKMLEILEVDSLGQIFEGTNNEIIRRTTKIINPYGMTKCVYFTDYDIQEKDNYISFSPGDTATLMIRLLKSYDLHSHALEFIATENVKVVEPYLAEILITIPIGAQKGSRHNVDLKLYDWVKKDTIIQTHTFDIN